MLNQVKFIYIAHFSRKEIKSEGRERERRDEQSDVRTSGGLLSRKRLEREGLGER